jgi:hypothetical protein
MIRTYILGPGGIAVPEPDPIKWAKYIGAAELSVAATQVGEARISTVFLGLKYGRGGGPPLLWETMVFGGPLNGEQQRYSSREDAERGHRELEARVRSGRR